MTAFHSLLATSTAACAAFALTLTPAAEVSASPAAEQAGCPAVMAAFMSGTGEGDERSSPETPVGLLAAPANALRARFGDRVQVAFPPSSRSAFNKGLSYAQSKTAGATALKDTLSGFFRKCPASKAALVGYSQGADSAGDVAADIGCGRGPITADRVIAIGLIADPHQGTQGGKLVGPPVTGTGIAGPRPDGFCGLSPVVAQFCDPADRYCSTNATQNPVIASLGRMLDPSNGRQSPEDLTTDFSAADPGKLADNVETIRAHAGSTNPADTTVVAEATRSALGTLQPLHDVASWAESNPGVHHELSTASPGSVQAQAGGVLATLESMDLPAAIGSLRTIGDRIAAATAPKAAGVEDVAGELSAQTAALTATPADQLSAASRVLSVLKPSTMIGQVTNVVKNGLDLAVNVPQILDRLNQVGPILLGPDTPVGKVDQLQRVFGDLNNLFRPIVVLAAGVDLHLVSGVLNMLGPLDPSGVVSIAALVVDLLGNLDVIGLARQFGQLQNDLWGVAHAIASGADPLSIGGSLLRLVPTALGFATIAVKALTGGTKIDPAALDGVLPSAAGQLVSAEGADSLSQLLGEGADALGFFTSGAHQSYDTTVIDAAGRTALQWLTQWLINRITPLAGPAPAAGR
ncbi:cutinase family protein [Aldersonia kunmingensis]|uniref:cutinase family protein n=1 Tax=Aldersonia kunmingensis TaxID=408066 RepID=UPI000A94C201|nr:cutinase family protein [Aldersonia kunmingensis]